MKFEARVVGYGDIDPNDYITLDHVQLHGADYSGRTLAQFCTVGTHLEGCRFENMRIDDTAIGSGRELSEFVDCSFDGAHLIHGGGCTRFVRCSFRNVQLRDWFCFKTEFIDCVFTGRLRKCVFNGTPLDEDFAWLGRQKNEFRGNDFSGAELVDVAFRTGIDLDLQRLPTGPDYLYVPDAAAAIERAKRGLADWKPDTELQRLAMVIVTVKANLAADGQRQFLMHLPEYYKGRHKFPREVVDKVIALFRGDSA